jgi:hypothetical protein
MSQRVGRKYQLLYLTKKPFLALYVHDRPLEMRATTFWIMCKSHIL